MFESGCVICSERGDIEIDHIVSVLCGGTGDRSNLQPLCRVCNAIKGGRRTNEELPAWIVDHPDEYARRKARRRQHLECKRLGYF